MALSLGYISTAVDSFKLCCNWIYALHAYIFLNELIISVVLFYCLLLNYVFIYLILLLVCWWLLLFCQVYCCYGPEIHHLTFITVVLISVSVAGFVDYGYHAGHGGSSAVVGEHRIPMMGGDLGHSELYKDFLSV